MKFRTNLSAAAVAASALLLTSCASGAAPSSTQAPSAGSDTLYNELPQKIRDAGELIVAADAHPPYRNVAADGKVTGIDPDLWDALGKELGVKISFQPAAALPAILTGLDTARYDAYNGPIAATPDREAKYDMVAWLKNDVSYLFPTADGKKIGGIQDVCGKNVAHGVGNIIEGEVAKLNQWCESTGRPKAETMPLKDTSATILALASGQADVAAMPETSAVDAMTATPDKYDYVIQGAEQGSSTKYQSLITPINSGLGGVMLKAFERIFANGSYDSVVDKWKLDRVKVDAPSINPETKREPQAVEKG
ncbi:transporter substrate-binding domain-containing protein [Arthrobacter sp. D3-16]